MGKDINQAIGVGVAPEKAQYLKAKAVSTGLTAAGSTISDALQLDTGVSIVETAASGTGVKLPECQIGEVVYVQNLGANDLEVYPPTSSGQINGASAGTAITQAASTNVIGLYIKLSATEWLGFVAAGPVT